DTFNENSPPTSDPDYISTLGAAVYQGISKGDKDAVWLMQGWLFYSDSSFWKPPQMKTPSSTSLVFIHQNRRAMNVLFLCDKGNMMQLGIGVWFVGGVALLQSVPSGKMIVLDLFADVKPIWKTSFQFYGTPYIWCMLHNFGGNIEMYGVLDSIASGPVDARVSANSTMVLVCAWKG
ncbi:alpha-N-acetylglucosaminidase-like, partial [Trifolium medium]|nr:alpha-N-acetylglucosaminidase-like [Trifolium medium]